MINIKRWWCSSTSFHPNNHQFSKFQWVIPVLFILYFVFVYFNLCWSARIKFISNVRSINWGKTFVPVTLFHPIYPPYIPLQCQINEINLNKIRRKEIWARIFISWHPKNDVHSAKLPIFHLFPLKNIHHSRNKAERSRKIECGAVYFMSCFT